MKKIKQMMTSLKCLLRILISDATSLYLYIIMCVDISGVSDMIFIKLFLKKYYVTTVAIGLLLSFCCRICIIEKL